VLQWEGFESGLIKYAYFAAEECIVRGINGHGEVEKLDQLGITPDDNTPPWIGTETIHSSHRSRLLCKGYGDSVCDGLKKVLRFKKTDDFLKSLIGKTKNELKYADVVGLDKYYHTLSAEPLEENYYNQFGWSDDPAAEYVWPSNIYRKIIAKSQNAPLKGASHKRIWK